MKSHLCLVIAGVLFLGTSSKALANTDEENSNEPPPLVEVFYPADLLQDYNKRREDSGWMLGLNYQTYRPTNFLSTLDLSSYEELFGSTPVSMGELQFSYKRNFSAGAVTLGLGYGMGQVSDNRSGDERTLEISKLSSTLNYVMDTLFAEPYVAPYLQLQAWRLTIHEKSSTDSFAADSNIGFAYGAGALIQLNFLDQDAAFSSAKNWGLQNTYLDLFVTKYTQTQDSQDPDTSNAIDYGAGLRFEF